MVHAARGEEHSARGEGRADHLRPARPHLLVVAGGLAVENCFPLRLVFELILPEADGSVARGGGEVGGDTRAEVERGDGAGVLGEHGHGGGRHQAPHPDNLVRGARGQQLVVLAHGHVRDLSAGTAEGEVEAAGVGAPHLDQEVVSAGEHVVARLVEQEAEHGAQVAEAASLQLQPRVHTRVQLPGAAAAAVPGPGPDTQLLPRHDGEGGGGGGGAAPSEGETEQRGDGGRGRALPPRQPGGDGGEVRGGDGGELRLQLAEGLRVAPPPPVQPRGQQVPVWPRELGLQ